MAQEYKIVKVSKESPREYYNETYKSTTYYIKVMLEGHDKPVTIGKKRPDALKEGDLVFGRIVETQYEVDKFQAEQQGRPGGGNFTPKDQDAIKAQWAIGQAIVLFHESPTADYLDQIEKTAKSLFAMVDRVKSVTPVEGVFGAKAETPKPKEDEVITDIGDEPINLDDIPF